MTDQPEKFDLSSMDVAAEQREKLKSLFPEAITEGGEGGFRAAEDDSWGDGGWQRRSPPE